MSSDSDDDFYYTNTASMLKALKKDISFSEEKNALLVAENLTKNEEFKTDIMVEKSDDNEDPIKSIEPKSEISHSNKNIVEVANNNDSCITLSDEEVLTSPINLISKIDSVLENKKRRSSSKPITGKRRGRKKMFTHVKKNTRQMKHVSNNFETLVQNTPDVCIIDNDDKDLQDANYEIDVKVLWMSQYLKKFSIHRFDKLQIIFKYFSERENIAENKLIFTIEKDGVILSENDTPDSININAATIIEGGLRTEKNQSDNSNCNKQDKECIDFKVQFKEKKRPITITMRRTDRMEVLMLKTAMELGVDVKNLKFYFDGDLLKSNDTINDSQLEGGECIDCIKYN